MKFVYKLHLSYKKILTSIPLVGWFFVASVFVYASYASINTWLGGYQAPQNILNVVYGGNAGSVCKKIVNHCVPGEGMFLPTKTDSEWHLSHGFLNKAPSCITIESCDAVVTSTGCTINDDCSANQTCTGYIAPVGNVCQGITSDINTACARSAITGTFASTKVQVDNCSVVTTQGPIRARYSLQVTGDNSHPGFPLKLQVGGGNNSWESDACSLNRNNLCKQLTKNPDSAAFSFQVNIFIGAFSASTNYCGAGYSVVPNYPINNTYGDVLNAIDCVLPTTGSSCNAITSGSVCSSSAGCIWGSGAATMGQCVTPPVAPTGCTINSDCSVNQVCSGANNIQLSGLTLGNYYSMVLKSGSVLAWGYNGYGQFGNYTNISSSVPSLTNITGVVQIAASQTHSCAVFSSGLVKCWGNNTNGELGNDSYTNTNYPVQASGITNAVQISVGEYTSCAVLSSGSVACWGANNNTNNGYSKWKTPDLIPGVVDAAQVTVGHDYSCVLSKTGGVKCWGVNNEGELGDGTRTTRMTPTQVVGLTSGVRSINAADRWVTCALLLSGTVKCWGQYQTNTYVSSPQDVGISNVESLSVGNDYICALVTGGSVKCWNSGVSYDPTYQTSPTTISGLTGVLSVSAGYHFACANLSNGSLKCWGVNNYGQLGNGLTGSTFSAPVQVSDLVPFGSGQCVAAPVTATGCKSNTDCSLSTPVCSGYSAAITGSAPTCGGSYTTTTTCDPTTYGNCNIYGYNDKHTCETYGGSWTDDCTSYCPPTGTCYTDESHSQPAGLDATDCNQYGLVWVADSCSYDNVTVSQSCSSLSVASCTSKAGCSVIPATTPKSEVFGQCIFGCSSNAQCSVGQVCNGVVPSVSYCDGTYEYTPPNYGYCSGPGGASCSAITDASNCNSHESWDTQGNWWVRDCGWTEISSTPSTQYCGQDFTTQNDCISQAGCSWYTTGGKAGQCVSGPINGVCSTYLDVYNQVFSLYLSGIDLGDDGILTNLPNRPDSDYCISGIPTPQYTGSLWLGWNCNGINGGQTVSCPDAVSCPSGYSANFVLNSNDSVVDLCEAQQTSGGGGGGGGAVFGGGSNYSPGWFSCSAGSSNWNGNCQNNGVQIGGFGQGG